MIREQRIVSGVEKSFDLRPVLPHNRVRTEMATPREQLELYSRSRSEAFDRSPRNVGIVLSVKDHDLGRAEIVNMVCWIEEGTAT